MALMMVEFLLLLHGQALEDEDDDDDNSANKPQLQQQQHQQQRKGGSEKHLGKQLTSSLLQYEKSRGRQWASTLFVQRVLHHLIQAGAISAVVSVVSSSLPNKCTSVLTIQKSQMYCTHTVTMNSKAMLWRLMIVFSLFVH